MTNRNTQLVLNRINWKFHTGELTFMTQFQIDVYRFVMKEPIDRMQAMEFLTFVRKLDARQQRSIMLMFIWLYQHQIRFTLTFGYNLRLPIRYNLKNILKPGQIRRCLMANGHEELMSCPLDLLVKQYGNS